MELKKILLDETPFIYVIDRDRNDLIDRLREFLTLGLKNNPNRRYEFHMPSVSRKRLGVYLPYLMTCKVRIRLNWFSPPTAVKSAHEKRVKRIQYAKPIIREYHRRSLSQFIFKKNLLDLFLHVNEVKSEELSKKRSEKLFPNEVIPLETCQIAQVAHHTKIPLYSFNEDFRYFSDFWKCSDFIQYRHLGDFLKTMQ